MSSPSIENIDRWLFEMAEGNLTPQQAEQLHHFVLMHPELDIDMDAWNAAKVQSENVYFDTSSLYQSFSLSNAVWTGTSLVALVVTLLVSSSTWFEQTPSYSVAHLDLDLIHAQGEDEGEWLTLSSQINLSKEHFGSTSIITSHQPITTLTQIELMTSADQSNLASVITDGEELTLLDNQTYYTSVESGDHQRVLQSIENKANTDLAHKSKSRSHVKEVSSFKAIKRRFKETSSKIQRMADQPIALRNSKDPHFHAPNLTGYQANFGMVGTLARNRFQATSRGQWLGKDNQQLINTLSWDGYVYALRGGLGIDVSYADYQTGGIENFNAGLTYSPKFSINNNISLEPAFRFKMGTLGLDAQSPVIGQNVELNRRNIQGLYTDGSTPLGSTLWYRDIGAGLLLNTKWFYAGVNVDNMRGHYNNIYSSDLTRQYGADAVVTSMLGSEYTPMGKDITFSGYLLHQKMGELNELWLGSNVKWRGLQVGAGMSNHLDMGASLGFNFDKLSMHYNVDYLQSVLYGQQFVSHQLTMRFLMKPNKMAKKILNI